MKENKHVPTKCSIHFSAFEDSLSQEENILEGLGKGRGKEEGSPASLSDKPKPRLKVIINTLSKVIDE